MTTTDSAGKYRVSGLTAGQYTVGFYHDALTALGLDAVDLYGTHTGASIASMIALKHPKRVRRLVLDGVGLYAAGGLEASGERWIYALDRDREVTVDGPVGPTVIALGVKSFIALNLAMALSSLSVIVNSALLKRVRVEGQA